MCVLLASLVAAAGATASGGRELSSSAGSAAPHVSHPHEALCFLFVALVIGVATQHFISRKAEWLPYSCALLTEGLVLAWVHAGTSGGMGSLSRSIDTWQAIDAHLILYAFLPALLFGDSMTLNTHILSKCLSQCTILAGPGVLIGTALTAVTTHFLMKPNYGGWDFYLCCTFGSIVSATDPVAVVGLLKDLGASPVLTMQITGESLLNDGVAIVLFSLFFEGVLDAHKSYSAASVATYFAQVALGGPLLGLLAGTLMLKWLRRVNKRTTEHDGTLQIILTLAVPYLTFFVAENEAKMSGVLATVVAAVVLAKEGRPAFVSFDAMEHFWHAVEFAANTLIFLLAGLICGKFIWFSATATDWGTMIALYLLANVIRGAMLLLCYPALVRTGYGTTPANAAFMVWGGLRGAVGLALALYAHQSAVAAGDAATIRNTELLVFFSGGMALFTLLINGTLSALVLRKLDLISVPKARDLMFKRAAEKVRVRTRRRFEEYAEAGNKFMLCDPVIGADVRKRVHVLVSSLPASAAVTAAEAEGLRQAEAATLVVEELHHGLSREDVIREAFLKIVRADYWEQVETRELTASKHGAAQLLNHSVEVALDKPNKDNCDGHELGDLQELKAHWPLRGLVAPAGGVVDENDPQGFKSYLDYRVLRAVCWCLDRVSLGMLTPLTSRARHSYESVAEQTAFYLLSAFISSHEHAQHQIHLFDPQYSGRHVAGASRWAAVAAAVSRSAPVNQVIRQSKDCVVEAKQLLKRVYQLSNRQHVVQLVDAVSSQLAEVLLEQEREYIHKLTEQEVLTAQEAHRLLHTVGEDKMKARHTRVASTRRASTHRRASPVTKAGDLEAQLDGVLAVAPPAARVGGAAEA
jgi:NhaP-type Na+/H+ or K+/H+ antiporter